MKQPPERKVEKGVLDSIWKEAVCHVRKTHLALENPQLAGGARFALMHDHPPSKCQVRCLAVKKADSSGLGHTPITSNSSPTVHNTRSGNPT